MINYKTDDHVASGKHRTCHVYHYEQVGDGPLVYWRKSCLGAKKDATAKRDSGKQSWPEHLDDGGTYSVAELAS